ncbi:MAG: hypothetical protein ABSD52_11745 [Candidatus Cybelea sp.]
MKDSAVWFAVAAVTASASTMTPPAVVIAQLAHVTEIRRFASLPAPIRTGKFTVDGVSAAGWQIAEPGGAFSATDVPVPGAPGRRLIFAACDPQLCLLHYERGGIAHFYEILALSLTSSGWKALWNARGSKPLKDLDALQSLLRGDMPSDGWSQQWVKGDF